MKLSLNTSVAVGRRSSRAFTLVEVLVVIAIIGVLAGLIVNLAPGAIRKKRDAVVEAQKQALTTMIESYKEKFGSYPPGNGYMPVQGYLNPGGTINKSYDAYARTNTLLYELTGATPISSATTPIYQYSALGGSNVLRYAFYTNMLGVGGIVNSLERQNFYGKNLRLRTSMAGKPDDQIRPIAPDPSKLTDPNAGILVLLVPAPLEWDPTAASLVPISKDFVNAWRYDCTSTNRHNLDSYDLWAVYSSGKQIITNGNWIQ